MYLLCRCHLGHYAIPVFFSGSNASLGTCWGPSLSSLTKVKRTQAVFRMLVRSRNVLSPKAVKGGYCCIIPLTSTRMLEVSTGHLSGILLSTAVVIAGSLSEVMYDIICTTYRRQCYGFHRRLRADGLLKGRLQRVVSKLSPAG